MALLCGLNCPSETVYDPVAIKLLVSGLLP